ncbi:MAG: DNA mismatch repair endonuclease MutL [Thermoflexibacter sp.]
MNIIRLLPDSLANQIAAGEVVQRPASVVKELLENAIDAGSSHIQLIIKEAGKTLIQVIDDGCGMSETDARMCFERHATSKIQTVDDLFQIRTLGFRGEALASIAAVAQVEMKTKTPEEELGTFISLAGSQVIEQRPIQCAIGTSIAVKNLFYNVPARRNFLKSNPIELKHIIDEFQRVALINPDIEFTFYHNDAEVYQLRKGKLAHRIVGLFGKNYKQILIPCEEELTNMRVKGYIGRPESAKRTRGEQFFFVNQRFIKHSYLNHAVVTAFEGLLPEDSFPFYVLIIDTDPQKIDVNVHPTKTEIKFEDERTAYALVRAAVRKGLGKYHLAPKIDFDLDTNFTNIGNLQHNEEEHQIDWQKELGDLPLTEQSNRYSQFRNTARQQSNLQHWEELYSFDDEMRKVLESKKTETLTFESSLESSITQESPEGKKVFQLHNRFIISQIKSGILLIDQQAAHERILYERFLQNIQGGKGTVQSLLFPEILYLSPVDIALLNEMEWELRNLGFDYVVRENNLVISGIPANLPVNAEAMLIEELIEQSKHQAHLKLNKAEKIAYTMSKRLSIGLSTPLSEIEISSLIDQLFACSNPNYAPDGKKIFKTLTISEIENLLY